jgi:hypothetical protein
MIKHNIGFPTPGGNLLQYGYLSINDRLINTQIFQVFFVHRSLYQL